MIFPRFEVKVWYPKIRRICSQSAPSPEIEKRWAVSLSGTENGRLPLKLPFWTAPKRVRSRKALPCGHCALLRPNVKPAPVPQKEDHDNKCYIYIYTCNIIPCWVKNNRATPKWVALTNGNMDYNLRSDSWRLDHTHLLSAILQGQHFEVELLNIG